MVQLLMGRSDQLQRGKMVPVKFKVEVESEDPLEEEEGPLNKRSKFSPCFQGQRVGMDDFPVPAAQYNPLDEPSPLGLRLRKSPSLLELIQMRLSQGSSPKAANQVKKDNKGGAGTSGTNEKLKASNFSASILRIGSWEYKSRYEGDLVAKCYFAKHKLVWEVLDGGLKNKIEIQWSDIMGLKANYPDDGPGSLDVVLARQPLFFRETNPQPRKHTLWQATSDFTGGQASIHRRHFLQCPQGLLGKHFEKLIQCDPRLYCVSQQAEITLDSPFFEPRISVFDDSNDNKVRFDLNSEGSPSLFHLMGPASPSGGQSSSSINEPDLVGRSWEAVRNETPSPSSVIDTHMMDEIRSGMAEPWKDVSNLDQLRVPGLHASMSVGDLLCHLENRVSEQKTSDNVVLSADERHGLEYLEEIKRRLFSDAQYVPASDEKLLMSRVNSLCCLLQKDPPTVQTLPSKTENSTDISDEDRKLQESPFAPAFVCGTQVTEDPEEDSEDFSGSKQKPSMSRKDSVGELLLNLPRIASLPQFLFNISEEIDSRAR